MRIYKYLFFLGIALLAACKSGDKVPDDLISEDRMPALVADIHIVDGDQYDHPQMPDSLYKYGMGYYLEVFKKHHTDTAQFRRSFGWYTKHPEKLQTIYEKAIVILQKKNDSITKLPPTIKPPVVSHPSVPAPGQTNTVPLKNAVPVK